MSKGNNSVQVPTRAVNLVVPQGHVPRNRQERRAVKSKRKIRQVLAHDTPYAGTPSANWGSSSGGSKA